MEQNIDEKVIEREATQKRVQKSRAQAKRKQTMEQSIEEKAIEKQATQKRVQKSSAQPKRKQTLEQKKTGRENTQKRQKRSMSNVIPKKRSEQTKKDKHRKRAKRNGSTNRKRMSQLATDEDDLSPYIDDAVKQAKKRLPRTQHKDDPTEHRARVCIVCDCFIMATEPLRAMNRAQFKAHYPLCV